MRQAFTSALFFYFIRKVTPLWGVGLIATSVIFLAPLLYIQNRELIDHHVNNAGNVINDQATQVRDLAGQHAGRAGEVAKSTMNQYTAKAQEMMGQAKNKASSSDAPNPANLNPAKNEPERSISKEDFPSAPKENFNSAPRQDFPSAPQTDFRQTDLGQTNFGPSGFNQTESQPQSGHPLAMQ